MTWVLISVKAESDQLSVRKFGFYLCDCQITHQPVASLSSPAATPLIKHFSSSISSRVASIYFHCGSRAELRETEGCQIRFVSPQPALVGRCAGRQPRLPPLPTSGNNPTYGQLARLAPFAYVHNFQRRPIWLLQRPIRPSQELQLV